jgi:hypothetical protein
MTGSAQATALDIYSAPRGRLRDGGLRDLPGAGASCDRRDGSE